MPRTTKDETQPAPDARGSRRNRAERSSPRAVVAESVTTPDVRPQAAGGLTGAAGDPPPSAAMTDVPAAPPRASQAGPAGGGARPATPETPGRHGQQDEAWPSYDAIARRAYELYQQRGGSDGQEVDDWLRAETELREGRGRREDEL
ncbi:MAG TPA: DUF2934 domain-containing protein [Vicinamibacteria bacterium]|nr:DUF2934 domain-containing protein [Vicinamibacteria bacterium]